MKELDYIKEINNAAKYCGKVKQKAYENSDYKKCSLYKNEQSKLYLLKALCILHFNEIGILKRTQLQTDENGTILELYSSYDKQYNFHLISAQKKEGNYAEYTNNRQVNPISKYYTYIRYIKKNLPEKYNKVFDVITNYDFQLQMYTPSEDALLLLKESGIHGSIQKEREDYEGYKHYYCNLYIDDIQICKVTTILDTDIIGDYISDESGYLEFKNYYL